MQAGEIDLFVTNLWHFLLPCSASLSTPGKLKNMPGHGGNRSNDLNWNADLFILIDLFFIS